MRDVGRHCAVLFAVLFLAGCAVSSEPVQVSHDRSSGKTTYETRQMRLEDIQMGSGLGRKSRFYAKVLGTCLGEDCAPSQFTLSFIKEGPQEVTVEGRDVTLTVGSETLQWEDAQTRETNQTATIRSGVFARVRLSSKQLSTVAAASTLRGTACGERFTLPHETRAPVRDLLVRLDQTAGGDSGRSSGKMR